MIRVAIIEDEEEAQKKLDIILSQYGREQGIEINTDLFSSGDEFLSSSKNDFDVIFLDIEMPGRDGLETAREIRKADRQVILVFVTNLAQMALEGYQVEALDFIIKPISKESFSLKMDRIISRVISKQGKSLEIRDFEQNIHIINPSDLLYVETDGHYIVYHMVNKKIKEYGTLKLAEEKLNDNFRFVRCNRSILVNLQQVEKIEKDACITHGIVLQISRPTKKKFLNALARYIGG